MIWKTMVVVLSSAALGVALGLAVKAAFQSTEPDGESGVSGEEKVASESPAMLAGPAKEQMAGFQRMNTYRGTEITAVNFKKVPIAREIAGAFARLDPKPPARLAHFQWAMNNPKLNAVGWMGAISRMEPAPGGWLVEINVSPRFEQGGVVRTTDRCVERWLYTNGTLQFIPVEHAHVPVGMNSILVD